jgi:hypothetical protein
MINCRDLTFSRKLATPRIEKAESILGKTVVARILAFALYLMGGKRSHIAKALDIPLETTRSLNRRILHAGIGAFGDRRRSDSGLPKTATDTPPPAQAGLSIQISDSCSKEISGGRLIIPQVDSLHRKVILLSLIGGNVLSAKEVAEALDLSVAHVHKLHRELMTSGIDGIMDKRCGQQQDYRVNDQMKGHILAEFVLALAETGRASSEDIADRVATRFDEQIAQRTVRHHLNCMGIQHVRKYLASGLKELKKNSDH